MVLIAAKMAALDGGSNQNFLQGVVSRYGSPFLEDSIARSRIPNRAVPALESRLNPTPETSPRLARRIIQNASDWNLRPPNSEPRNVRLDLT
jgi:hypothetical protein